MCSIAIPSEIILGHGTPVYGSFFYNSLMVTTPSINNRSVPPQIRPCLTSTSLHLDGLLKSNTRVVCTKGNKKKVVFADDHGKPLTQVRVMSEPSNMPPLWTSSYVINLTRNDFFDNLDNRFTMSQQNLTTFPNAEFRNIAEHTDIKSWEPTFIQPASDYLAFRNKLDKNSVSLENIVVSETENSLIGTVKVKNFAYNKTVTIRTTIDNWKSHKDVKCIYVHQPGLITQTIVRNLYDTFRFLIPLPINNNSKCKVEFCVHYVTDGRDFWDNNEGTNYIVKKNENDNPCNELNAYNTCQQ